MMDRDMGNVDGMAHVSSTQASAVGSRGLGSSLIIETLAHRRERITKGRHAIMPVKPDPLNTEKLLPVNQRLGSPRGRIQFLEIDAANMQSIGSIFLAQRFH